MEIQLAPERVFRLEPRLSAEEAERKAMDRRTQAIAGGLGGLLQRPRPEDIVLVARQHRLEPFWHVACSATYAYERRREYKVPAARHWPRS